jgi:hypothetical protein
VNYEKFMHKTDGHHIKGHNPDTLCTKLYDGINFRLSNHRPDDYQYFPPIYHKLPKGIHSYERERERRLHSKERMQYEFIGDPALCDVGNTFPKVNAEIAILIGRFTNQQ